MKLKIKNLVLGSNLESVLFTYLTDSKLLFFGNDEPKPWETISQDIKDYNILSKYYKTYNKHFTISDLVSIPHKKIYTKLTLYQQLVYELNIQGKCLNYNCIDFDRDKTNLYVKLGSRKNRSVCINFDKIYFINYTNFNEKFLDYIVGVDDKKIYTLHDTFLFNEPPDMSLYKLNKVYSLNKDFPSKFVYFNNGHDYGLNLMSILTEEQYINESYPEQSYIFTLWISYLFPQIIKQRNIQRSYKNLQDIKYRNIVRDINFKYKSYGRYNFLYLDTRKLVNFFKFKKNNELRLFNFDKI